MQEITFSQSLAIINASRVIGMDSIRGWYETNWPCPSDMLLLCCRHIIGLGTSTSHRAHQSSSEMELLVMKYSLQAGNEEMNNIEKSMKLAIIYIVSSHGESFCQFFPTCPIPFQNQHKHEVLQCERRLLVGSSISRESSKQNSIIRSQFHSFVSSKLFYCTELNLLDFLLRAIVPSRTSGHTQDEGPSQSTAT